MDKLRMEQEKQQTLEKTKKPNFDQHVPQPLCA